MAVNIINPMSSSFEPTMTASTSTSSASSSPKAASGLRRNNTLKAYLANKNKLKERQAINVIVDPNVLQQEAAAASADPSKSPSVSPISPSTNYYYNSITSPVSGKRIDTDLDALDARKKAIEDQLAVITQQLNQHSQAQTTLVPPRDEEENASSTNSSSTHIPLLPSDPSNFSLAASALHEGLPSKSQLQQEKTRLCEQLDNVLKERRELLQSWARDYKNLKRSGSLAKKQDDLFWVTTA